MRIRIKVRPQSGRKAIEQQADGSYIVRVPASPVEGKANEQVVELLAQHFDVAKSLVRIARGAHSKEKVVEIKGVE